MYKIFLLSMCFISSFCFGKSELNNERFYLQDKSFIEYDGRYFRIMNFNGSAFDIIFAKRIRANSKGIYVYKIDIEYVEMH